MGGPGGTCTYSALGTASPRNSTQAGAWSYSLPSPPELVQFSCLSRTGQTMSGPYCLKPVIDFT